MDIKKYFTRQFAPVILVIVVTVFLLVYHFVFSAPSSFIKDGSIIIEPGQTVSGIAQELAADNVVRSPITFKVLVTIMGGERSITAGLYAFPKPQNIFSIAFRIAHSDFGYTPIKFTVPEGLTSMEIAKLVHDKFPDTDQVTVAASLKQYEGELFPDTYFFPPQAPLQIISDRMLQQFNTNIAKLQPDIASSTHSLDDIIKVA